MNLSVSVVFMVFGAGVALGGSIRFAAKEGVSAGQSMERAEEWNAEHPATRAAPRQDAILFTLEIDVQDGVSARDFPTTMPGYRVAPRDISRFNEAYLLM